MAQSCIAADLLAASKCLCGIPSGKRELVMIYLLQQLAGLGNLTAAQLLDRAKCLCGLSEHDMKAIEVALLCTATGGVPPCPPSGGGAGSCASLTGDVPPTGNITPGFVGQLYIRNPGPLAQYFYSTGTTSADWTQIPSYQDMQVAWTPTNLKLGEKLAISANEDVPGLLTLESTAQYLLSGVDMENQTTLQTASFPNLIACNGTVYSAFSFSGSTALISISAPLLQSVHDDFIQTGCAALTTISLPSLQTVGTIGNSSGFNTDQCAALTSLILPSLVTANTATMQCNLCPLLTTVDLSMFVPTNGQQIAFDGCALSVASVNHILARCIANAGYVSGIVDLQDQTPPAPPSGQGIADKATLIGRGVTVNTD